MQDEKLRDEYNSYLDRIDSLRREIDEKRIICLSHPPEGCTDDDNCVVFNGKCILNKINEDLVSARDRTLSERREILRRQKSNIAPTQNF